jgi:hypothetical protein
LYSRDVNAEFNWWLLIVGLVVGAGLVWLVVADSRRREADLAELEREGEAQWIAAAMADAGRGVDETDVLDILRLHSAYLAAVPPDQDFDDVVAAVDAARERPMDAGRSPTGDGNAPGGIDDVARTAVDDRRWIAVPESKASPGPGVNRR